MKTDVSIHFTIKNQSIESINDKLDNYFSRTKTEDFAFNFSEPTEPRSILHHCFLPEKKVIEKGLSTEIYDSILHSISEDKVCWFGTSDYGLEWDRRLMLENLKKINGIAVFVGEIIEGVKDEFDLANGLELDILLIP